MLGGKNGSRRQSISTSPLMMMMAETKGIPTLPLLEEDSEERTMG